MARAKNFLSGLSTGYLVLFFNTLWTLVSLPVALHYLAPSDYSLWLLVASVAGYLSMIDLGTSGAGLRLLMDHKDAPAQGAYGGIIKSMWVLSTLQAALLLAVGLAGTGALVTFFDLTPEQAGAFRRLWIWQVIFLALNFIFRIGSQLLQAHQRMDLANYAQAGSFLLNLALLLAGLHGGLGLDSFILAQGVSLVALLAATGAACARLGLLPARGAWGKFSRAQMRRVLGFGTEFFLITVGTLLTTGSQILLLKKLLPTDAALTAVLVWSVMTKLFTLGTQVASRLVMTAGPALSEMVVRGELERLWRRYRTMVELSLLVSAYLGLLIAVGNNAFVEIWTRKPIAWPEWNNGLLAVWLLLLIQSCCHTSLILHFKQVGRLKAVYLAEGFLFVLLACAVVPWGGITGMLACSIVSTGVLSVPYLNRRIAKLAGQPVPVVLLAWSGPAARFLALMLPPALALAWWTRDSAWLRLLGCVLPVAGVGAWVMLRFCLPGELRSELLARLPARGPWTAALLGHGQKLSRPTPERAPGVHR